MGLNYLIHFLNVEQLLGVNFSLPDIIRIDGDEMGFTDFETGHFTYVFLKGDIRGVMVFAGGGGLYFIEVVVAILTGDEDINFANESWCSYQGVEDGGIGDSFLKGGIGLGDGFREGARVVYVDALGE